ncbi:MAG: SDR family NAD(P)-dependent oxidoreductase [Candidatus Eisenbacteria bacterium]|nr:SDR family NAD(P)-dependent oxidoreductase [Candidatus Latescibacterota bacterium]MBD3303160.1 SDR family NAD(P)-dependent oxidoreductase [Candidatus Eisenbacteria bacterium]
MDCKDRIVLITGASSGIGRACARAFGRKGARLVLAARRRDRLGEIASELGAQVDVHPLVLDVRDPVAVERAIGGLPERFRAIDVLVNNAGLSRGLEPVHEGLLSDWEEMIDTNVKGLLHVSKTVLPGMLERGRGDVINVGSIAGHESYPGGNVYCATKAAVRALTAGMRMDYAGTPIRISTVDPGMVETEFSLVRFHGDAERAKSVYRGMKPLSGEDVADAILYVATRPAHVNVAEMLLLPEAQGSATIVRRET